MIRKSSGKRSSLRAAGKPDPSQCACACSDVAINGGGTPFINIARCRSARDLPAVTPQPSPHRRTGARHAHAPEARFAASGQVAHAYSYVAGVRWHRKDVDRSNHREGRDCPKTRGGEPIATLRDLRARSGAGLTYDIVARLKSRHRRDARAFATQVRFAPSMGQYKVIRDPTRPTSSRPRPSTPSSKRSRSPAARMFILATTEATEDPARSCRAPSASISAASLTKGVVAQLGRSSSRRKSTRSSRARRDRAHTPRAPYGMRRACWTWSSALPTAASR